MGGHHNVIDEDDYGDEEQDLYVDEFANAAAGGQHHVPHHAMMGGG